MGKARFTKRMVFKKNHLLLPKIILTKILIYYYLKQITSKNVHILQANSSYFLKKKIVKNMTNLLIIY